MHGRRGGRPRRQASRGQLRLQRPHDMAEHDIHFHVRFLEGFFKQIGAYHRSPIYASRGVLGLTPAFRHDACALITPLAARNRPAKCRDKRRSHFFSMLGDIAGGSLTFRCARGHVPRRRLASSPASRVSRRPSIMRPRGRVVAVLRGRRRARSRPSGCFMPCARLDIGRHSAPPDRPGGGVSRGRDARRATGQRISSMAADAPDALRAAAAEPTCARTAATTPRAQRAASATPRAAFLARGGGRLLRRSARR